MPESNGASAAFAEIDDLVTLAALACRAPAALLATFEAGQISALRSYGLPDGAAAEATGLIGAVAAGDGLVEIDDLAPQDRGTEPAERFHSPRWACGVAIRAPGGEVRAVIAVVDIRRRELASSDQTGLLAVSRRIRHALISRPELMATDRVIDLTGRSEQAGSSQVLRCSEVAEIYAVSERTVMKWAAAGRIPSFRTAGGRLRFRHEDIVAFIEEHSTSTS